MQQQKGDENPGLSYFKGYISPSNKNHGFKFINDEAVCHHAAGRPITGGIQTGASR